MRITDIRRAITSGANELINGEAFLTALDSKTGDGDHGLTMAKIGKRLIGYCEADDTSTASRFFFGLAETILSINGGSIVSIWAEMMYGIADEFGDKCEFQKGDLLIAINAAMKGIENISSAKPGDKTLVDTLYAVRVACAENANEPNQTFDFNRIAQAAAAGAKETKNMVSKFGRAKQLLADSVGYLDPGAVSMSLFIKGIADCLSANKSERTEF